MAVKCRKCGGTGRDTRAGICDRCVFGGKTMSKRRKLPARAKNGRFKKRK
jgi:ribosomal protein L37E